MRSIAFGERTSAWTRLATLACLLAICATACGGGDTEALEERNAELEGQLEELEVTTSTSASTAPSSTETLPNATEAGSSDGLNSVAPVGSIVAMALYQDSDGNITALLGKPGGPAFMGHLRPKEVAPSPPDPQTWDLSDVDPQQAPPAIGEYTLMDITDVLGSADVVEGGAVDLPGGVIAVPRNAFDAVVMESSVMPLIVTGNNLAIHDDSTAGNDPAIGLPVPGISGSDFDGRVTAVTEDGRPRVLLFCAHWAPHCQAELPALQGWIDSAADHQAIDIVFVSTRVRSDQSNYPPSQWLDRVGWSGRVIVDDELSSAATAAGVYGMPHWVFVDGDGTVAHRHSGTLLVSESGEPRAFIGFLADIAP